MSAQPTTSHLEGIAVTDTLIDGDTAGLRLFLRNKRSTQRASIGSLLLVHGATFPSISLFDVDVEGVSFMDALALAGIDAWALDVRGYGGSTRPGGMEVLPAATAPLVPATEAAGDVATALAHVRAASAAKPVGLLGMSWGGSIAGLHASHDHSLNALVLVAPLWVSAAPLRFDGGAPIMSHRLVNVAAFRQAWLDAAPEDRREQLLPPGWFERWAQLTGATDPTAPAGFIRAPSGAIADVREHWTVGDPLYDPAAITAPTLITRGTWDVDVRRDMALDLFDRLTAARSRAYLEIADGTHMMLMEPVRRTAFAHIIRFVEAAFDHAAHRN